MIFKILFASLLFIALPIMTMASPDTKETNQHCRDDREITANDYYYWHVYTGMVDTYDKAGRRYGYYEHNPEICFSVSLDKLGDIRERILGYKLAAQDWLTIIVQHNWDDPDTVKARQKFKAITGMDFNTVGDPEKWWQENNDYLTWSVEHQRLAVDEAAKANKAAIISLDPVVDIPVEDYWYYEGMDLFDKKGADDKGFRDDNEFRFFNVMDIHRLLKFRVALKALDKASDKEAGYLKAVASIMQRRLSGPYLEILEPKEEQHFFEQLEKLTAQKFDSRDGWLKWWKKSKGHLALSKDGKYLTLKQGRH